MTEANPFLVGAIVEGTRKTIVVPGLSPRQLTRDEALNLAAHLLRVADEPVAFEQGTFETCNGTAVVSIEFLELLASVTEGT